MSDDDLFAMLPKRQAHPPAQPQRTATQEVGRQLGLTARHAISGAAALPGVAADAVSGVVNTGLDAALGKGNGFRFQKTQHALDNVMNRAGLPQPENAVERVVGDATSALAGAGGSVAAGRVLERAAAPVAQQVGKGLAIDPTRQLTSAASSAGAAGATREGGGGEGAQLTASVVGALGPALARPRRVLAEGGRQVRDAAQRAHAEGYVIPPADLSPGVLTELASGLSGKIKTAQVASERNQTISNNLARKALGLMPEQDLNIETLEGLRRQASAAYAPVAAAGTVTPGRAYLGAINRALHPFRSQSASFPGARVPGVVADLEALKTQQFDSGDALNMIRALRESADASYRTGEKMAGKAYAQGAAALEDAIEAHLSGLGKPGATLLSNFRDARQMIARTYSVQNALNPQTGSVNAVKLAADLRKGKPLSGELKTIAEVSQAFPKATQALKESPKQTSPLDVAMSLGMAFGTGSPLGAAAIGAHPAARAALLSAPVQRGAVQNAGTRVQRLPDGAAAIAAGVAGRSGQAENQPGEVYTNRVRAGHEARRIGGTVMPVEGGFVVIRP